MPKTNFEMRGNLNQKEPVLVEKWQKEHLYEEMLKNRERYTAYKNYSLERRKLFSHQTRLN